MATWTNLTFLRARHEGPAYSQRQAVAGVQLHPRRDRYMYVDTSPAAIEHRAAESIGRKHHEQMVTHQNRYGKLGELQSKAQRNRLAQDLKRAGK